MPRIASVSTPKSVTGKESAQMVTSAPVITDAPPELSRKNGHEAMENLLLSQAAASKKPDQLARGIDNADGADAVMRHQFIDALDRRVLRNEKLRVHGAHRVPDSLTAPFVARDFLHVFERKNPE